jgi:carbonic anhydrase/acetyltransferase-like protein (isoleucine patch superfamily)
MNGKKRTERRSLGNPSAIERLDGRVLLNASSAISPLLNNPTAYQAVRPNTPVMPFATPAKKASFIDPTVSIVNGSSIVMGYQNFIGPYATLDGTGGAIKIGNGSDVLDNSSVVANAARGRQPSDVLIGNSVVIGFGANISGPASIGSYADTSKPVSIGANAEIDGATIDPGAIVSPLARVGAGVTVPTGFRVLPGVNVTTEAEASNPSLGMVVPVTAADLATIQKTLSENESLASGYTTLYQGSSATGASPGANPKLSGINNGNLSTILGAGQEPGTTLASFEPSNSSPAFAAPNQGMPQAILSNFPARITGEVEINMRAWQAAFHLGRANSIRADQGQPIQIGSIARTGRHVTINSPLGGQLTIGQNFNAGNRAVVLSGPGVDAKLGNNVTVGARAVVTQTSLGSNSSVGQGAYLLNSTFPANTVIPPKAIYINNKFEGYVQW